MTQASTTRKETFTRRRVLLTLGALAIGGGGTALFLEPAPVIAGEVVVYKDQSCECCGRWVRHMRQSGFSVAVNNVDNMDTVKSKAGIPEALESCHTASIDGFLVEGHVPAQDIRRLLKGRPAIKGLAVPGMPLSAPGMDNPEHEPYTVLAFDADGATSVFSSY